MLGNIHHKRAVKAQATFMRIGGFGHRGNIQATVRTKSSPEVEASRAAMLRKPV